jgi:hypothetical protein
LLFAARVQLTCAVLRGVHEISHDDTNKAAIDQIVSTLFSSFNNRNGKLADLNSLSDIFLPNGAIVKTCGEPPTVLNLADFVAPRDILLNGGELEDFSEEEIWERTDIFGSVAQRFCLYKKSGALAGEKFETRGMKSIQLVNTESGWKIASLAWDDERSGVSIPVLPGKPDIAK